MPETTFQPNWASPPGDTIASILKAKEIPVHSFSQRIGLAERQTLSLIEGKHPIDPSLAERISETIGSTPRFWIERERKYQENMRALRARRPELDEWFRSFPTSKMRELGWLPRMKGNSDAVFELLDFFAVSSIEQWRRIHVSRLEKMNFRTSPSFENSIGATTAWIRQGEVAAEEMQCRSWNMKTFRSSLGDLKALSREADPKRFLPALQRECAKHGVAVVVERCPAGCAASGAAFMIARDRALLLLSARFLTDDHFWFSFFHEAGHLILHNETPTIESELVGEPKKEAEANLFAQEIILGPDGDKVLRSIPINKFAIARLARRCNVSPGIIVGQLQNRRRISPGGFGKLKFRYKAADFIRESVRGL